MKGSERTVVTVARVSMLSVCTATGCTTIVFGQGTCIEHDARDPIPADNPLHEATDVSDRPEEAARTLSPTTRW